jgi:hypothetical protein
LKAPRNIGLSATDSARALNVAGTSLSDFFHQTGTRINIEAFPVAAAVVEQIAGAFTEMTNRNTDELIVLGRAV